MTASVRGRAPRNVFVVLAFDASIRAAVEDEGKPFHDEFFVGYVPDDATAPIVRCAGTSEGSGGDRSWGCS
jgi:hypothetical protein